MRILVCGGRTYDDRDLVWRTLDDYQRHHGSITIIQGGATGADALAKEWCYRQPKERHADRNQKGRMVELHYLIAISATFVWDDPVTCSSRSTPGAFHDSDGWGGVPNRFPRALAPARAAMVCSEIASHSGL